LDVSFFAITIKYFLHLGGTYKYCLNTYGPSFMEKYIGNSLTTTLGKKGIIYTDIALANAQIAHHNM